MLRAERLAVWLAVVVTLLTAAIAIHLGIRG